MSSEYHITEQVVFLMVLSIDGEVFGMGKISLSPTPQEDVLAASTAGEWIAKTVGFGLETHPSHTRLLTSFFSSTTLELRSRTPPTSNS